MPFLEKVAAKDGKGRACVGKVGLGGSGHYVKMVHNGIEHGMMSAISEAFDVMAKGLGMSYEEIGNVFDEWNKNGPLVCIGLLLRYIPFIYALLTQMTPARHIPNLHRRPRLPCPGRIRTEGRLGSRRQGRAGLDRRGRHGHLVEFRSSLSPRPSADSDDCSLPPTSVGISRYARQGTESHAGKLS